MLIVPNPSLFHRINEILPTQRARYTKSHRDARNDEYKH